MGGKEKNIFPDICRFPSFLSLQELGKYNLLRFSPFFAGNSSEDYYYLLQSGSKDGWIKCEKEIELFSPLPIFRFGTAFWASIDQMGRETKTELGWKGERRNGLGFASSHTWIRDKIQQIYYHTIVSLTLYRKRVFFIKAKSFLAFYNKNLLKQCK